MKPVDEHPRIRTMVRVCRILMMALVIGVCALAAYGGYVHFGPGEVPEAPEGSMLLNTLLIAAVATLPVLLLLRSVLVRAARDMYSRDIEGFCRSYQVACIVQGALVEGVGLFGGIVYLLTGDVIALGVAGGAALLILLLMPSESSVNTLLEDAP